VTYRGPQDDHYQPPQTEQTTPGFGPYAGPGTEAAQGYAGPQASAAGGYAGPQAPPASGYEGRAEDAPGTSLSEPPAATNPADGMPGGHHAPPPPTVEVPSAPPDQPISREAEQVSAPPADLPPLQVGPDGKAHIDDLLRYVVEVKASDLHAKTGSPPMIRVSGHLEPIDYPMIKPDECHGLAHAMMTDRDRAILEDRGEVDFAYSLTGAGRFRVNVHRQRGSLGIAARRILPGAPSFEELGLPPAVEKLAQEHRGMLLVTGPTSSGKTTTCGAILKHINRTRRCHIVTVEDPIEILHNDEMSVVTQREVGTDTTGFYPALRAAMRQDPDVIFVGEIRDTETVGAALQAAETGHFVLATLHTTNVAETINRVIDFFPADQQKQVRMALGSSLVGVMSQRLLRKVSGGRAPAIEVMINNGRIRDCIVDPDKTHNIHDIVKESDFYGMQTFDQALIKLYQDGLVTLEDAKSAANRPHDFELELQKVGLLAV
jgi:twitching motility protein PilT